jgi:hypothetical protein
MTAPTPAVTLPVAPVHTPTTTPHAADSSIPNWMIGLLLVGIPAIMITSFAYSNGTAAITNTLLGFMTFGCLWLLWVTPSSARHIEGMEALLGIALVFCGIAIGSSPTAHPKFAEYWQKVGLAKSLPIDLPKPEYWKLDGRTISATPQLPAELHLVVLPKGNTNGIFVDGNGYVVPAGMPEVRLFVQNKVDDRTSSSIAVSIP